MNLGVPRETDRRERRVALVPQTVRRRAAPGHGVVLERWAGADASFTDEEYTAAGARIVESRAALLGGADAILSVQRLSDGALEHVTPGAVVIGLCQPATAREFLTRAAARGVTVLAMELVPRITKAQAMDVLSSQATVAGYVAVLIGASRLARLLPMLTTAAGTIPPGRAFILGAGVAGLQAIATARRLGAVVSAFDVRPAVKEQVESLGAKFLQLEIAEQAEAAGGYAKQLSEETHRRELAFIAQHVKDADVVITTAAIPGQRAPILITADAVRGMKPGAVIVDLAAETGGNCEVTEPGSEVRRDGVIVLGPLNLPSTLPLHASQMYARNVSSFLLHLVRDGRLNLDFSDEIIRETCVTHAGEVRKS